MGDFGCENFGCKVMRILGRNKRNGWFALGEDSLSFGTGL
jgi:N6-adenosine-specific RNA methylase IME4